MTGDPPQGTCFLLALELFCENARNHQLLHYLRQMRGTWLLVIVVRKQLGLSKLLVDVGYV
jgi:hypothetical protein